MSTAIMGPLWKLTGMSMAQKAVLMSMADQANDDGVCWPAVGTIATRCCMSERAVRSALDHLEKVGLLHRSFRHNASTTYTITPAGYNPGLVPTRGKRKVAAAGAPPAAGAGGARGAGGAPAAGEEAGAVGGAAGAGGAAAGAGPDLHGAPPNRKGTVKRTVIETSEGGSPAVGGGAVVVAAKFNAENVNEAKAAETAAFQEVCRRTWDSYSQAYAEVHGAAPVRNASVNAQIVQIVKRIGVDAPDVAAFFLTVKDKFVVQNLHQVGALLRGCEGFRTQWFTGRQMTTTRAQQIDATQTNADAAEEGIAILARRRAERERTMP